MQSVANLLLSFIHERHIEDDIKVLPCDGTNTNVRAEGGANHFIETAIERALQWDICLLHANELPLRHLII